MSFDPDAFKQEYIQHLKSLVGDELVHLMNEQFDVYLDRIADVYEYLLKTFDQSRYILKEALVHVIVKTARENIRTTTKMIDSGKNQWHINERLEYIRAISQTALTKFEPLL